MSTSDTFYSKTSNHLPPCVYCSNFGGNGPLIQALKTESLRFFIPCFEWSLINVGPQISTVPLTLRSK